jgi:hypothetical protein
MSLAAKAGRAEAARDSNIRRTGLLRVRPYTAGLDSASGPGAAFIRLPLDPEAEIGPTAILLLRRYWQHVLRVVTERSSAIRRLAGRKSGVFFS